MIPQFQDGSISGWSIELNATSLNGTQYPARPVADNPRFEFPHMPSGKPGLKLHPGKYWQEIPPGKPGKSGNSTNTYYLTKEIETAGGTARLKAYCPLPNNGFLSIYISTDFTGCGDQVATAYGTKWMDITFPVPAGKCVVTMYFSGDARQSGADMGIDEFYLPE